MNALRSAPGRALLDRLAEAGAEACSHPSFIESLRREHDREVLRIALRVAEARRRAPEKFPRGDELFFTPELLEQASAHPPALHRARRLAPLGRVLDLGCGAGGDLTRLALEGAEARGLERDGLALEMARANLCALGLQAELALGSFPAAALPAHDALFADPSRRAGSRLPPGSGREGRRRLPSLFSPPPSELLPALKAARAWCVKWGPGLDLSHEALSAAAGPLHGLARDDYELELVSWRGDLREAVLWGGEAPRVRAAATLLSGALADFSTQRFEGDPGLPPPSPSPPGEWIFEPDASLIRSGLLNDFARRQGLRPLQERIAYLSADHDPGSPFLRSYRRLESFPFSAKRLQAALDRHGAGEVILKKRGFPIAPEALRRRLRWGEGPSAVIILHRGERGHWAHFCRPGR